MVKCSVEPIVNSLYIAFIVADIPLPSCAFTAAEYTVYIQLE